MKKKILTLTIMIACVAMVTVFCGTGYAAVSGQCANCHTMHNSQGGDEMATFGGDTGENNALVRGSCLGCHGQSPGAGGADAHLITDIPQVLHKGTTNLAGGNFTYIAIGGTNPTTGSTTTAGHNVYYTAITDETVLTAPPGDEHGTGITNTTFTCAGTTGCHGDRATPGDFASISGAHHGGVGGACDGTDLNNSYRFLNGVKGYENMDADDKYQNKDATIHNEYYGIVAGTEDGSATAPGNSSISGLCAECHGDFHGIGGDIGDDIAAPFSRHPTDIVLPNKTEYSAYTAYSVEAPVARPSVYGTINTAGTNDVVAPGTDVVMCLSCHGAHATAYEDILRWDYTEMDAASAFGNTGCFTCHTTKDDA